MIMSSRYVKKNVPTKEYEFCTWTQGTLANIDHIASLNNFQSPVPFFEHSVVKLDINIQKLISKTP